MLSPACAATTAATNAETSAAIFKVFKGSLLLLATVLLTRFSRDRCRLRAKTLQHLARQQPGAAIVLELTVEHGDRVDACVETRASQPTNIGQEIPLLLKHEIRKFPRGDGFKRAPFEAVTRHDFIPHR